MTDGLMKLENVSKIFHEGTSHAVHALENVNFSIHEGNFIAIMGPSGSGKTTLLNVLTGNLKPTSGSVKLRDGEINLLSEEELSQWYYQNIGFVYQDYNLLQSITNYENMSLVLSRLDLNKKEINQRIVEAAKQLSVEEMLEKYPSDCSGGQQQRIAIARVLAQKPLLLVGDEPTGNLDSQNTKEVMEIFNQLNQQGLTIVLVTHDIYVASFAKEVFYINDGKIEASVSKADFPSNQYIQKLIELNSESF